MICSFLKWLPSQTSSGGLAAPQRVLGGSSKRIYTLQVRHQGPRWFLILNRTASLTVNHKSQEGMGICSPSRPKGDTGGRAIARAAGGATCTQTQTALHNTDAFLCNGTERGPRGAPRIPKRKPRRTIQPWPRSHAFRPKTDRRARFSCQVPILADPGEGQFSPVLLTDPSFDTLITGDHEKY